MKNNKRLSWGISIVIICLFACIAINSLQETGALEDEGDFLQKYTNFLIKEKLTSYPQQKMQDTSGGPCMGGGISGDTVSAKK